MRQPIDVIVQHSDGYWKHIGTGQLHRVLWVSPREVVTWSMTESWVGSAAQFIREFEVWTGPEPEKDEKLDSGQPERGAGHSSEP
jgi:hypothetical protein